MRAMRLRVINCVVVFLMFRWIIKLPANGAVLRLLATPVHCAGSAAASRAGGTVAALAVAGAAGGLLAEAAEP